MKKTVTRSQSLYGDGFKANKKESTRRLTPEIHRLESLQNNLDVEP